MSNDNRNNEYREELERAIQEFKEKHGKYFDDSLSEEDSFEYFLNVLRENILTAPETVTVLNPLRMMEMISTYKKLKKYADANGLKIEMNTKHRLVDMGSIKIEGKRIEFENSTEFLDAVRAANNFSVYACSNGNVSVHFTFNDISLN